LDITRESDPRPRKGGEKSPKKRRDKFRSEPPKKGLRTWKPLPEEKGETEVVELQSQKRIGRHHATRKRTGARKPEVLRGGRTNVKKVSAATRKIMAENAANNVRRAKSGE